MNPPPSSKPAPRNGLATAAFVLSLFACIPGLGLLAFVLAVLAYRQLHQRGTSGGTNLAFFAVVVGGLSTLAWAGGGLYMAQQVRTLGRLKRSLALYRVDLADGSRHLVFDAPGADDCPAYTPDGHQLVFQHQGAHGFDLWVVDLATGKAHPLTHLDGDATAPAVSPDGRTVAFRYVDGAQASLGFVPLAGGRPRLVPQPFHDLSGPRYAQGGTRLVLSAIQAHGSSRVRILPANGTPPGEVVAEAKSGPERRMNDADPDWNGDRLAFARGEAVVVVDEKTSKIAVPYSGVIARAVHLQGRTLYFASNLVPGKGTKGRTRTTHLVRGDLEGDPTSPVVESRLGIHCFDVSPDGRHVAVALPRARAAPAR